MKHIKKVLAWMLVMCMLIGLVPSSAYAADTDTDTVIDAAIFCSDVHGESADLKSVLSGIDDEIKASALGLNGDTCLTESTVESTVHEALSYTPSIVYSYAASHDTENGADISTDWNYSGEAFENDNYIIYTICETDMQYDSNAATAATAFTTWYDSLTTNEKAKPIFILSHRPLHDRRDDNAGAATWYNAISTAAETSDIVFFWAHNHTGETSVDTHAYYVEKDGSETITVEGGSTVTPNFTYMNAGYINANGQEPARKGVATTVQITAESMVFQDYNSSGEYSGEYAHNVTVERDNASTTDSGETETKTLSSIAVTTEPTTITYNVGDTFSTEGLVVTATYSDDTTATVTGYTLSDVDMTTAGTKTVTVTYTEGEVTQTATFDITVSEANSDDTENDEAALAPTTATVTGATTTETKTVYVLVNEPTAGNQYIIASSNSAGSAYALKENTTTGTSVTINASGSGIDVPYIETSDETIMWNTASEMTFQSENGGYYLIQSQSGRSRSLSFSTSKSTDWTVGTNSLSYEGKQNTYYVSGGSTWSLSSSSANVYFYEKQTVEVTTSANGTYSIAGDPSEVSKVVVDGTTATLGSTLTFVPESGTTTTTDTSTTATYTIYNDESQIISGISGNTVTFTGNYGTATVKVSYTVTVNGTDYTVDNYITVTATEPTYEIEITKTEKDEDGNRGAGEVIEDTIVIKGETAIAAGYDLWADVTYTTADGVDESYVVDADKLTWSSNNTSIATVDEDGIVTFTGGEGSVQITVYYEYADGKKITDTVTFSVSKSQYITPSDGTNDFPEYPNQGSIRIDKTGVAVGNFSQTGLAQIELSMTGVPYGTSTKTDVVIMVDMTASMSDDDVTAAESAVKELIRTLVYDEENDVYDSNIQLFVDVFYSASSDSAFKTEEYLNNVTIGNAEELTAAQGKIDFTQSSQGGGTRYNLAMKDVYETLNRDGHADNQFVVFVSDGVPTAYAPLTDGALGTTITGSNSETDSLAEGWFDDDGEVTDEFETEYYSYLIKTAGIPIYTVGANLSEGSDPADVLNHMSSNYSPDGKTSTGETKYSFFCTTSGGITDEVLEIFHGIGQDIKEAATNVVVEDKIADEYTMNFSLPSGVTADEAGMDDFYIQVVGYELDDTTNERSGDPEVLEKFLFNSDGTITHTIGSITCGDTCTHVTYTNGVVTAIDGTYFDYSSTTDGEILTWTADKLDRTELALQYFVYLDNSAGDVAAADQVEAGTYPTNEYATITYTNFNGNECKQYFPVPSLTWNGAQVTYVFYLVNEAGQPVNRAGKVVPFAEAVYVTEPYTYDVTWNEETGSENMLAENLFASAKVPDVYELYDQNAYYEIRVYQTEGVDQSNDAKNYNYFIIDGSDSGLTSYESTKVFNTKAGTKYDDYGVYSSQAKESTLYTTDADGNVSTVTVDYQTTDIDYANTTVAFAVVWKPALVEDTVVVDYGLDVVVDVYTNDGLAAGVTGVMASAPSGVTMNSGTYATAVGSASITSDDGLWTASKENLTSVRFKQNTMGIKAPVTFYYEAGVNYYIYDASNNATLNTTNMYSSVTVIPATTVYYEDSFVTYTDSTATSEINETYGKWIDDTDDSGINSSSAVQATDRPGADQMGSGYDADNIYGYDAAYDNCTQYSLGSAKKVTVDATTGYKGSNPTATFTFHGTGFDLISLTDNDSGMIKVTVQDAEGTTVKTMSVNNYYGYSYEDVTVENEDGTTTTEKQWVVVSSDNPNALYQVPVIQITDLAADTYTVTVDVMYMSSADVVGDGQYSFWLDAVRIYDPAKGDAEVEAAYTKDGETNPGYIELRDLLIAAGDLDASTETLTDGVVFIDGIAEATISDYEEYGPNNEVYLSYGQSVAFKMVADKEPSDVQIGAKLANGTSAELYLNNAKFQTLNSATDRNYVLDNITWTQTESGCESNVIVLTNKTEGTIISLTNLKAINAKFVTYSGEEEIQTLSLDDETEDTVAQIAVVSTYSMAQEAITLLSTVEEDDSEEVVVFVPGSIKASWSSNVKAGKKATLKITTSEDVETISVNGEIIDEYKTNSGNGNKKANKRDNTEKTRVWTYTVTTTEAGSYDYTIIAYDEDGNASEPITATLTVKDSNGKKSSTR